MRQADAFYEVLKPMLLGNNKLGSLLK